DPSQSSYRWTLDLFKNDNPPTAILFQTEAVNGIFKGLDELDLQPGKDVALIGYDDLEIVRIHRPSLSVLRPQAREAGQRVVNILLEVIKGEDPGKFQEIHQVEMVIRETSLHPS
ncbi:MAG: substrate-binding domain-containing protein, partial [SAR324 cluster bacterium]|nr:substrate-binding domain-containing protein [SAR324 cluster bacterium]